MTTLPKKSKVKILSPQPVTVTSWAGSPLSNDIWKLPYRGKSRGPINITSPKPKKRILSPFRYKSSINNESNDNILNSATAQVS